MNPLPQGLSAEGNTIRGTGQTPPGTEGGSPEFLPQPMRGLGTQGLVKEGFGPRVNKPVAAPHPGGSSPGTPCLEGGGPGGNLPGSLGGSKRPLAPSRKLVTLGVRAPERSRRPLGKAAAQGTEHEVPDGADDRRGAKAAPGGVPRLWEDILPSVMEG